MTFPSAFPRERLRDAGGDDLSGQQICNLNDQSDSLCEGDVYRFEFTDKNKLKYCRYFLILSEATACYF